MLDIRVQRLPGADDLPLPDYATPGASGMDLCAAVTGTMRLAPGETALVPTGLRIAVPDGYEGQVRPRSGLALRHGVTVLNGPGTIDSDYRGEVQIILINLGREPVEIERGQRIAQLVLARVERARMIEGKELPETIRGGGGFGHTGK